MDYKREGSKVLQLKSNIYYIDGIGKGRTAAIQTRNKLGDIYIYKYKKGIKSACWRMRFCVVFSCDLLCCAQKKKKNHNRTWTWTTVVIFSFSSPADWIETYCILVVKANLSGRIEFQRLRICSSFILVLAVHIYVTGEGGIGDSTAVPFKGRARAGEIEFGPEVRLMWDGNRIDPISEP